MLDIKFLYKTYCDQLQYKLQLCNTKINEYDKTFNYLKTTISEYKDDFQKYNINIDNLLSYPFISYSKISHLTDNDHLSKVVQYIKAYSSVYRYMNHFKLIQQRLIKCNIPYNIYREIVYAINREISAYILEGGIFTIGILGKFFIVEKENVQFASWSKPIGTRIDWGATNENKKRLREKGIGLYNEHLNPNGTKYFKYHNNDFDYWWSWLAGAVHNRGLFRFYPNSYLHNMGRSIDIFVKKAKSNEQIIYSTAIGNEDKMRALLKFDKLYYLKYRRPDFNGRRFMNINDFNNVFLNSTNVTN